MPRTPSWFNNIQEIRSKVEATDNWAFDKIAIADNFGINIRQASKLLVILGAEKFGGAFIVSRGRLLAYLNGRAEDHPTRKEQERKAELTRKLTELHTAGPPLCAARPIGSNPHSSLPAGVSVVAPGELRVRYDSPDTVLGVILALAELADLNALAFTHSLEYRPTEEEDEEEDDEAA
jgi:hypothetical protein